MPTNMDNMVSVAEAAAILRVHPSTIRRWIETGELKAYRMGPKRVLLDSRDLSVAVKTAGPARPATRGPRPAEQRLSHDEGERLKQAIANSRLLHQEMRALGPLTPSWVLINEGRDERSNALDEARTT